METLLPIRRRASQHPRRANRSPRDTRPSCTLTARPCAASQKNAAALLASHYKNHQPRFNRNQQYSITAVSDGSGAVIERYAYSAYGQVTIFDSSESQISNSEISNRYTYTGREWDEGLNLYHYRARMYDAAGGRFVSRDPIGYSGSPFNIYRFATGNPLIAIDPLGLKDCKITLYAGHNYEVIELIDKDYRSPGGSIAGGNPWIIPDGECIAGIGCGINVDVDGDGKPDSIQDYLNHYYPCNSISAPDLCRFDDPRNGLAVEFACGQLVKTFEKAAQQAARRMVNGQPPNPNGEGKNCDSDCDSVTISIKCGDALKELSSGLWEGRPVPAAVRRKCGGICDKTKTIRRPR